MFGIRSRFTVLISILILLASTTGCSTPGGVHEQTGQRVGTVVGQVIGVASGNNYPALRALGGAAIGSYIGGRVGKTMDDRDRQRAYYALEHNRDNRRTSWTNRSNQHRYVIVPTRRARGRNNAECREYTTESYTQGRRLVYYGYACRDSRGYWRDARR